MADFTLFHRPFNRSNVTQPNLTYTSLSHDSTFSETTTPPTPQYNSSVSQDFKSSYRSAQFDLEDPFVALYPTSFQEVSYTSPSKYNSSDLMDMASPSKNNFAQQVSTFEDYTEDNDDTIMPDPVVEYDLTDNGYSFSSGMDSEHLSTHKRNQSGESTNSTSTKWWKLGRQRHNKSNSASTHPISDTGRASSRTSSFTSARGDEFDARSSTVSFQNQSSWVLDSPPVSPSGNFSFPSPQTQSFSQHQLDNRPTSSRDGQYKLETGRALHSKKSSLSSVNFSHSHSRQRSAQSLDNGSSLTSSQDKWALALGHANYTVEPEPYAPEDPNLDSWRQLLDDRESAHSDYCKQRARIIEHYGLNSKQFKLTEAKWAEINSEWEQIIRMTKNNLLARGTPATLLAASASCQSVRMPTLNPHVDGKFPKLGDEDIVGPMAQSEPLQSRDPSPARKQSGQKWKLDKIFSKPSSQFWQHFIHNNHFLSMVSVVWLSFISHSIHWHFHTTRSISFLWQDTPQSSQHTW